MTRIVHPRIGKSECHFHPPVSSSQRIRFRKSSNFGASTDLLFQTRIWTDCFTVYCTWDQGYELQ